MEQGDINNKDCDYIKFKNPTVVIQKIISLIAEQITKNDVERQQEYINRLTNVCKTGFLMSDLHDLMFLIELLLDRIEEVDEYSYFLDNILHICAIPPIMTRSSDILRFSRSFEEYFRMLGYTLASLKNENLQVLAADVLMSLLTKDCYESRRYVSLEARINCALKSQLLEILTELLQFADEKIYPNILNVIKTLIKAADEACQILIEQDALNYLLMRLEPTWKERFPNKPPPKLPVKNVLHYDTAEIIILMLLKYLTNNKKNMKEIKNIQLFSLWNLQYAFRFFARTNQAMNRNNILLILIKIINLFPDLNFVASGLAKDFVVIGLNIGSAKSWAKDVKLSSDDEDRSYLELLISILPLYIKFFGGIRVLEEERVVYRLLSISKNKSATKWNPQQVCVLSHLALDCLMKIVPFMEEEFIENSGPTMYYNLFHMHFREHFFDFNLV